MAGPQDTRSRAKAAAADGDAARRRAGLTWPDGLAELNSRLRKRVAEWALAEVAPGRLVPWLAVAFGTGVVVYFAADREPAWWAAAPLARFLPSHSSM
jgi:competence protein ComEC